MTNPCHGQSWAVTVYPRRRFLPTSLLLLYFLLLLPRSLLAKPTSARELEKPGHFILKTPLCKPVSHEDLQRMMGPYFDPSKMAADMAAARSSRFLSDDPYSFGHSSAPAFQGDDPRASRVTSSDDLVQDEILWASDEESEWDDDDEDDMDEGVDDEDVWIKEKEAIEGIYIDGEELEAEIDEEEEMIDGPRSSWRRRSERVESTVNVPGRYKHKHRQHRKDVDKSREDQPTRQRVFTDPYAYMKRRRRKRSPQSRSRSRDRDAAPRRHEFVNSKYNASSGSRSKNNNWASSNGNTSGARRAGRYTAANSRKHRKDARDSSASFDPDDKSDDIGALPLRIALSRKNKGLRKSLKQKFRQNAKYLSKRRPPWQCRKDSKTLIMNEGVFPRVLVDGDCGSNRKCFYRLYDCKPERYNIKLMQRDPNHCNPLPTIGNTTVFEERWNLISRQITVGCNCVNAPLKRKKSRNGTRRKAIRRKAHRQ